jgi:hypothetical protein
MEKEIEQQIQATERILKGLKRKEKKAELLRDRREIVLNQASQYIMCPGTG